MTSHVANVCGRGGGGGDAQRCPITGVHSFDKALPLAEPLHADAVYDHRRLLLLECLVQLWRREGEEKQKGAGCDRAGRGEGWWGWRLGEDGEGSKRRDGRGQSILPIRGVTGAVPVPLVISIKLSVRTHTHTRIHLSVRYGDWAQTERKAITAASVSMH